MYILSVSVNGETVRTDAFASIVDAASDYADVISTGFPTDTVDRFDDALSVVSGGFVIVQWDVPNVASDAGDGFTEVDTYRVTVQYATSADVESDDIPVIYSRGIVAPTVSLVKVAA